MGHIPVQGQLFEEKFEGGEFVLKTFLNSNVDNTFMYKHEDVVILVDEGYSSITIQLGGSSHATYDTGNVKSVPKSISCPRPSSNDVGDINTKKRAVLEEIFGEGGNLYDCWVTEFGEGSIQSDTRE